MKIYTRTGDDGTTALGSGERRPKYDLRIAAYGTVDETNAAIGVVRIKEKRADRALVLGIGVALIWIRVVRGRDAGSASAAAAALTLFLSELTAIVVMLLVSSSM